MSDQTCPIVVGSSQVQIGPVFGVGTRGASRTIRVPAMMADERPMPEPEPQPPPQPPIPEPEPEPVP
jgi:hypothetical protein